MIQHPYPSTKMSNVRCFSSHSSRLLSLPCFLTAQSACRRGRGVHQGRGAALVSNSFCANQVLRRFLPASLDCPGQHWSTSSSCFKQLSYIFIYEQSQSPTIAGCSQVQRNLVPVQPSIGAFLSLCLRAHRQLKISESNKN